MGSDLTAWPWHRGARADLGSNTFAVSHRVDATRGAGCVAERAEGKKADKYVHLGPAYLFQPIAIETSGAIGPKSRVFLKELGKRVALQTGEAKSTCYLLQRLSIAVQRGNAAAVLGCAARPVHAV